MDSDRLARFVAGEADAAERAAVEHWAAASPANARELDAFRAIWSMAEGDAAPDVDVDRAWNTVEARIEEAEGRVVPLHRPRPVVRWLAIAAMLTGLVFAARFFFAVDEQQFASAGGYTDAVLTDSSNVVLSPHSSIAARMDDQRHVTLKGQAYFEVRRDTTRPFVVEAGDVLVTVLGTSFEVTAFDSSEVVLVRVREGRVQVAGGRDSVVLTAGEHARYDKRRHVLERVPAPPAEIYGLRVIQFERATMVQVAAQLERIFHVRVELRNPALERCMLTAGFDDEPLDDILRVIAATFGMRVEHPDAGLYTLDGDGC